jgi:hypothetical protein
MRGANVRDTYGFVFEGSVEAQEDPYKVQERIAFRDFHPGAIVDIGDAVYECTTLTPHPVCRVHVKAVEDLGIRTKAVEVVQARRVSDGVSATRGRVQLELADWKVRVAVERYDRLRRIDSWACPIDGCAVGGGRGGRCPRHKRRLRYSEDWRPEGAGEIVPALDCEVETVGVRLTLPMSEFLLLHPSVEHEAIGSGAILKGVIVALLNAFREVFLVETDVLDGAVLGAEEILLFDDFPGGLGICENVFFDGNDTLLRSAAARVEKCKCPRATGCMACTLPKHSFEGDAARKEDVLAFLRLLTDAQELPAEPVREGNVVLHRHYGCGTVLVAEHRAGIGFCVTVQFAEPHGRRTVLGTYLQRVGASRGSLRAMPRDGAVEEEGVEEGR